MPFPSPGDLHNPATEPATPALGVGYFTTEPSGKPLPVAPTNILDLHKEMSQAQEPTSLSGEGWGWGRVWVEVDVMVHGNTGKLGPQDG